MHTKIPIQQNLIIWYFRLLRHNCRNTPTHCKLLNSKPSLFFYVFIFVFSNLDFHENKMKYFLKWSNFIIKVMSLFHYEWMNVWINERLLTFKIFIKRKEDSVHKQLDQSLVLSEWNAELDLILVSTKQQKVVMKWEFIAAFVFQQKFYAFVED